MNKMKDNMILIILLFIINNSFEQNQNYCDLNHSCSNCIYCGENDNQYCSCNFYNGYCYNSTFSKYEFSNNFLLNYDGCITSNGNVENICGKSDLFLENGETKTINFPTTASSNFLCYYNFQKSDKNNNYGMGIKMKKKGFEICKFDLYYILYNNNKVTTFGKYSDKLLIDKDLDMTRYNCDKISLYLDIEDPKYLDEISLIFSVEGNQTSTPTTVPTTIPNNSTVTSRGGNYKSDSSSNSGLIIGLIAGGIALIIAIILAVIIIKNCRKIKDKDKIENNNSSLNNDIIKNNNYAEYTHIVNTNKEKMDNLFKTELLPKIYNKSNTINDCYNCTICMEDFIDNSSIVVTTKCGHTFHQLCIRNWAYKNIICPKCPNCNYLILGPESEINLENLSIPQDLTLQTGGYNTTIGITH